MAVAGTEVARSLMHEFARDTGLASPRPPRRYLWTDAFAVCNFLALADAGRAAPDPLPLRLVGQVHQILGRHRDDDTRTGWISGLDEIEGERHPTAGGLRIGKPLPERGRGQAPDPQLEWERDGQYFHYLTRWMHALDRVARVAGHPQAGRWARELAQVAHRAFAWTPAVGAPGRMFWKMSIDLQWPQVASMGQHDPLDGLVTCLQLRAHADPEDDGADLAVPIREFARMTEALDLASDDPLGIGGLLVDAWRLLQLPVDDGLGAGLPARILDAAAVGLDACLRQRPFERPAAQRLAFRELGLAIGLHAVERMLAASHCATVRARVERLATQVPLAATIESFWLQPQQRRGPGWRAHQDINTVMLATSLAPAGYLDSG